MLALFRRWEQHEKRMDYRFGVLVQLSGAKYKSGQPVPPGDFFPSLRERKKTPEEKAVALARALGYKGELTPTP